MADYQYPLTATPNARVSGETLVAEISAAGLPATTGVSTSGSAPTDVCTISFAAALTTAQQATLGGVVAAHLGNRTPLPVPLVTASLVTDSKDVPSGDWQEMNGIVTEPGFFCVDVARLFALVQGAVEVTGGSLEIRLVEQNGAPDRQIAFLDVPSNGGVRTPWKMVTSAPTTGEHTYLLQARRAGACTAAKLWYTRLVLCRLD